MQSNTYSLLEAIAPGKDIEDATSKYAAQQQRTRARREEILAAHYMRQGQRPATALEQAQQDLEVTK